MSTFKVGDKVRRINTPFDTCMVVGYEGTVTRVSGNGLWINVDDRKIACEPTLYAAKHFELIPEEPEMTTPVLKNMKIRIKDEEHSRLVQEALFDMGYVWAISCASRVVEEEDRPYLICEKGRIYHCSTDSAYFEKLEFEEVELVTTYTFKPVDQEAKRKAAEKEALQKNAVEMQKQLDEMKQKLESMQ